LRSLGDLAGLHGDDGVKGRLITHRELTRHLYALGVSVQVPTPGARVPDGEQTGVEACGERYGLASVVAKGRELA
jgi:hypothetical protein